ncbi:hypothetical protein NUW58_g1189 [Xylaria curta]|uniref:Uncharacterized protein n=1 Tax=Xylaria curta TaxID=42375 RepID=A0ACC1PPA3_9PEZI|nr:hypothetical protein NUW58_g1189 [Xylaria curta]
MSAEIPLGTDLSQIPLLPNPDGSPPNFIDPPSLEGVTVAVSTILLVVSTILVPLRLRTNYKIYGKFAYDDYFCIIAWVLAVVYAGIVISETPTARHVWDLPISLIDASWVKRTTVLGTIYGPAMWFAKTAILTLYLRLFNIIQWLRWCCYFGIVFLFAAYWSLVPVSVVYNFPHGNEEWGLATTANSAPSQVAYVTAGAISVVSDIYILFLPFPILHKLQLSSKRKIGLGIVFLAAIIGIISSIFVFYFRIILWQNKTLDSSCNVAASYVTVVVEMNVAVVLSCTPAVAASWKLMLRDSGMLLSLRYVFRSTRSLVRVTSREGSAKIRSSESMGERGVYALESLDCQTSHVSSPGRRYPLAKKVISNNEEA